MSELQKILCVDDEPNVLDALRRQMRGKYDLEVTSSPLNALELIKKGQKFSVVISDMRMPAMDGVQFLKSVQELSPLTVRVMLTGNNDQGTASQAVNEGQIFRFVNKPCSTSQLELIIDAAINHYKLINAEKELLQNTLAGAVRLVTEVLSISDPIAFGAGLGLREQAKATARELSLTNLWEVELAAMLSPIGWVGVPEATKNKARTGKTLTAEEQLLIDKVPEMGQKLISTIPRLEKVGKIILYTEKNYDGSGLPLDSIKAKQIPIESRILKISRSVHSLESKGHKRVAALKMLIQQANVFDVELINQLISKLEPKNEINEPSSFEISAKELLVGHKLRQDLFTADGRLLLGSGTVISELLFESINNYATAGQLKMPIVVDVRIPTNTI